MRRIGWGAVLLAAVAAVAAGALLAPTPIAPWSGDPLDRTLLLELRVPRAATAFAVGALLALAGCLFQALLGNPLAEPYVLGASGSSAIGAVLAIRLAPTSGTALALGAFAGAWLGVAVVTAFARYGRLRLLLAGVALAAFWSAMLALLLALLSPDRLQAAMAWLMGDLSRRALPPSLLLAGAALLLTLALGLADRIDRLLLGERHAAALGEPVHRLRARLVALASLATATAVAAAGTIGFVGLVAPHAARIVVGARHRVLLPASALLGGAFLTLADAAGQAIATPREMPAGVVTALIGAPLFAWLLTRRP